MSQCKDKTSEIDEHIARRFDVQKRLGKGAYGIVWKAVDRKTKEVVAVKKIFDAFRNQTDAQRTFREIMFLQAFKNHPNIVSLHSVHRAANNKDIYLGFEYMETDLHNVIKRGNILKDIHKRYIMYQMLKATKYIHSGNVIHRDQKPSNVLLDTLCRCKIADFGLARSLTRITETGFADNDPTLTDYVATRWYRAPEILIANRKYTKGIDMWSLGCILGEMVAGKPLFPGSSTVNQVEKIMTAIPIPSQEDINSVCLSGVGSSMIRNACTGRRVSLKTLIEVNASSDAFDLINRLLIFNPAKRLTAEEALKHPYVAKFHNPSEETVMQFDVIVPLNDDVRLSVDDYRDKLYEIMSAHQSSKILAERKMTKIDARSETESRLRRGMERYPKVGHGTKDKPQNVQSEPKLSRAQRASRQISSTANVRSDLKISKGVGLAAVRSSNQIIKSVGEGMKMWSGCVIRPTEKPTRKRPIDRNNLYSSFNSYNKSHGIITQSALTELRAAGIR